MAVLDTKRQGTLDSREQPMFMRCEPILATEIVERIATNANRIAAELGVNRYSDDCSPFRNSHWVEAIVANMRSFFSPLSPQGEIDYAYSATIALQEILWQIHRISDQSQTVYIDRFEDRWSLSRVNDLAKTLFSITETPKSADILVLTHGTPELGLTSLQNIDLDEISEDTYIIIDAAGEWPSLFVEPWKSKIQNVMARHRCVIVGDFRKVMGYSLNIENITIPINCSFSIYSRQFWEQRMEQAESREHLSQTSEQRAHWQRGVTRSIGSFPAMNLVYPLSFLDIFGDDLPEYAEIALRTAEKIRSAISGIGQLGIIAAEIPEERLSRNDPHNSFVTNTTPSLKIEDVVPAFQMSEKLHGLVRVYPMLACYGEEALYQIYIEIVNRLLEQNVIRE